MADVKSRNFYYNAIKRLETRIGTFDASSVASGQVATELQNAETWWAKLNEVHMKIVTVTLDADQDLQEQEFIPMEEVFTRVKSRLLALQTVTPAPIQAPAPAPTAPRPTPIKLPEMSLPTFDGKYEDWPTFSDLFKATVNSHSSLSDSYKLTYLKSCVKGEAASIISSYQVTDANYKEAWEELQQYYDNKREIIHAHIKKLLFQQQLKSESPTLLQQMLTTTQESLRSLKVLGRPTDQWDDVITVLLIEKFDGETRAEWARSLKGTDPPTYKEVQDFIISHIRTLHAKGTSRSQPQQQQQKHQPNQGKRVNVHHNSSITCQHCKQPHQLFQCQKLKVMSPEARASAVKASGACFMCLQPGHSQRDCTAAYNCKKCNKRHNTFLHIDKKSINHSSQQQPAATSTQQSSAESSAESSVKIHSYLSSSPTILKTALVDAMDSSNVKQTLRVFIDDGGEGGLIRESAMVQLGLRKEKVNVTVTGIGGKKAMQSKWKCFVRLHSQVNNCHIDVELYAVPGAVTGGINRLEAGSPRTWTHIEGLRLADPYFYEGGEVDILLGGNTAPYLLRQGLKQLVDKHGVIDMSAPVAQETIFGWVLIGNVGRQQQQSIKIHTVRCEISSILRKFWEIEEVPSVPSLTQEEAACEQHFLETHSRQADGRYIVRLPFNKYKCDLGESWEQSSRRLVSQERRFKRQPQFKPPYIEFMQEYEQLGHMEKVVSKKDTVEMAYYLPHHFVLKEDSTTTKQRTVFDGSAKTSSGLSLNDVLMVGATVQSDLYSILLCFRYNKVALKADIAKMYRQFIIHPDDRDYQRILWREDDSQPVQEYRLTTVTYGTKPAPFLATRCLNQLAIDEGNKYPAAAKALLKSTYVDDFLGTSESSDSAISLVNELIGITATAGMEIRKWCTNDSSVLQAIPEPLREQCDIYDFEDSDNNTIKALGIKWQPSTDEFMFNVNVDNTKPITKRFLLSEISKTFDPIGWLAPVTINAKLLLQKVWLVGTDWDSVISPQLQEEWQSYITNLEKVTAVRIPRCVVSSKPVTVELHGFCDSSELAFCVSVYLKCVYADGHASINLLTSKTKVAPMKMVSLPKLELCGAKLLAELISVVRKTMEFDHELYCWTDSTITLRWISAHSRRWKTFVANRVSIIQSLTPPEHWHHVRSQDNPADLPTRGLTTEELIKSNLWWQGPSWLKGSIYPMLSFSCNEDEVKKEERAKQLTMFHFSDSATFTSLCSAFSSFDKLLRITGYLIRFINLLKSKKAIVVTGAFTTSELNIAKKRLIRWSQSVSFHDEIQQLKSNEQVKQSSKLISLSPFLDNDGILRVGGRLQKSGLPASFKHPIILQNNYELTNLLISDIHRKLCHGGFSLVYASLRRQFWIIRGRDTVRFFIKRCITCRKAKATTMTQLMGNLPVGRVTPTRPFLHCGVDFAGPYNTKLRKGRHFQLQKTYFAIFVCLATKAIHLEVVTSLSSEAFIACYERFVSRRGVSAHLYSDCGTNFVGADKMMRDYLRDQQEQLQQKFAIRGTNWHFNPPAAPHQGGLWEAGVKSVKFHFTRVVGADVLQLEQFQTLLCKIEACLNSRPLCAMSPDPLDLDVLTPGHFLIGEPLTNIPEPDLSLIKENRLSQWEIVRQKTQHFWKRWSAEYLSSLQQRFKWKAKRDNAEVGDLVVIADDQSPVAKWRLGRIILTHPGEDGLVRSVTMKTSSGELKRPISKICPLISMKDNA